MTFLKDDGTLPERVHKVDVIKWPDERLSHGLGVSIQDGWNFGIGLGLALTIAVPFILMVSGLVVVVIFAIFGIR